MISACRLVFKYKIFIADIKLLQKRTKRTNWESVIAYFGANGMSPYKEGKLTRKENWSLAVTACAKFNLRKWYVYRHW
jgi:hypothetical protein